MLRALRLGVIVATPRRRLARALLLGLVLLAPLSAGGASSAPRARAGELLGRQWQVSDLAPLFYAAGDKWHDAQTLGTALAVAGSESFWHDHAYNDNTQPLSDTKPGQLVRTLTGSVAPGDLLQVVAPNTGTVVFLARGPPAVALGPDTRVVTSRDVGLMQINVSAEDAGSSVETALYDVPTNIAAAYALYDRRGFQPWFGYTLGVYLRDTYQKIALRGLANWLFKVALAQPTDTLSGVPYEHTLSHPLLDFYYRTQGLVGALNAVKAELYRAIVAKDWDLVKQARIDAANATLIAKR